MQTRNRYTKTCPVSWEQLHRKPAGRPLVDVTVNEVSQDTWILFPWDSQVSFCTPIAARDNAK